MRAAVHFWVSGKVQGVYFRGNTQAQAEELGLTGWVRNLPDGQVEGVACGEQSALDKLVTWLAKGPRMAKVTHLELQPEEPQNWPTFEIE
jgi:acylphosphatase